MIKCNKCNAELADNAVFCSNCGEKLLKNKTCPGCNAICENSVKFCSQCGFNFSAPAVTEVAAASQDSVEAETVSVAESDTVSGVDQNKIAIDQAKGIVFQGTTLVKYPEKLSDFTYEVPMGITKIGKGAFRWCDNLRKVILPDTVNELEEDAFYHCEKLTSVNLSDAIKKIGKACFAGCSSLENVTLPQNLENLESQTFVNCSALTSITIPVGIITIPEETFYGCKNLTEVIMHPDIDSIGSGAFARTALKSVKIPKGVKRVPYIADSPFADCDKMTTVYIHKQSVLDKDSIKRLLPKRSIFNQVSIEYYS